MKDFLEHESKQMCLCADHQMTCHRVCHSQYLMTAIISSTECFTVPFYLVMESNL